MTKGKKPTTRETPPAKSAVTDIEALLAERRKYEDWISALEAKKEQTPPHVFTRVHADYEQRLKAAMDKLASQSGSLGLEKSRIEKRLEELDLQIKHREDERSEIELRAHVGEMSEDDVAAAVEEADEELAKLNTTRTAALSDLGRISELLSSMSGGGRPAPAGEKPPSSAAPKKSVDEMSFLQSVLGNEASAEAKAPPPRTSQPVSRPTPPAMPQPKEKPAQLAVEKEVEAKPAAPAAPPAAPAPAPRPSVAVEPTAPPAAPPVSTPVKAPEPLPAAAAPPKPRDPTDPLMFNPSTAAGMKSLKCKKCGTMNDPRDWYCEKCGAELSVV